jgi:hypothetical protein
MLVAGVLVRDARRIRVAQYDRGLPVDGCEHEACGHECAQGQHDEQQRR